MGRPEEEPDKEVETQVKETKLQLTIQGSKLRGNSIERQEQAIGVKLVVGF